MEPDGTAGEYEYNECEDGGWRILELKITLLQCVYACVYMCVYSCTCMYTLQKTKCHKSLTAFSLSLLEKKNDLLLLGCTPRLAPISPWPQGGHHFPSLTGLQVCGPFHSGSCDKWEWRRCSQRGATFQEQLESCSQHRVETGDSQEQ